MKTETTRDDLIKIRGEIDKTLTELAFSNILSDQDIKKLFIAVFRAIYAMLNFVIRKTWGI